MTWRTRGTARLCRLQAVEWLCVVSFVTHTQVALCYHSSWTACIHTHAHTHTQTQTHVHVCIHTHSNTISVGLISHSLIWPLCSPNVDPRSLTLHLAGSQAKNQPVKVGGSKPCLTSRMGVSGSREPGWVCRYSLQVTTDSLRSSSLAWLPTHRKTCNRWQQESQRGGPLQKIKMIALVASWW